MAKQKADQIFRQEALDHLSTPEQLDQLLRIVTLRSWVPLAVIAGGILAAVVWSIVGRIPVTVQGTGLLLYPHQISSFQSPASGQLIRFGVRVDDMVEAGQELGRINKPELHQRLAQERVRLEELERRDQELRALWEQRTSLVEAWIARTRARLTERIASIRQTAANRRAKSEDYFQEQRQNLAQLGALTETIGAGARDRYERVKRLAETEVATDQEVADAQRIFFDNQMKLADVGLRKHELELQKIEAEASYLQQVDLVAELDSKLDELSVELAKNEQLQREAASERELEIQEARRDIRRLEQELEVKGRILADHSGRILEVTAAVGQIVREGQRLGAIEAANVEGELQVVAYYGVADGKKILSGMSTQVSPTTVQRERFGSMIGRITSVSSFPVTTDAVTNTVGNAEVARRLTSEGNKIEVVALLEPDPSSPTGFRWTSGDGPQTKVSAGTTVSVRTTVESRRPISYLIPLLRRWSGSGG